MFKGSGFTSIRGQLRVNHHGIRTSLIPKKLGKRVLSPKQSVNTHSVRSSVIIIVIIVV